MLIDFKTSTLGEYVLEPFVFQFMNSTISGHKENKLSDKSLCEMPEFG